MYLLVFILMPGEPQSNLSELWVMIRALYVQLRVPRGNRYSTLKLTMFKTTSGCCKLRGTWFCTTFVFCVL